MPTQESEQSDLHDVASSVTDEELFEGEIPEVPKEEPKEQETETKEDRPRDEKGRFAKAEEETTPEPEPVVEQTQEEKPDHRVPLMELLNERDKRQEEQRRREAIEQQFWALQQQLQQQAKPQEEPIDIFADPQAYQQTVEQRITSMRREMEGNFSLRLARATHKELFDEAWSEMVSRSQSGDDAMRQQVLNSSDPGETLVSLYKQAKTFKEVNGDPNAWLEAKKAEWLKDPTVQAQILEAVKASAGAPTKTQIKVPPSLNKAGAPGNPRSVGDAGDQAVWDYANG